MFNGTLEIALLIDISRRCFKNVAVIYKFRNTKFALKYNFFNN